MRHIGRMIELVVDGRQNTSMCLGTFPLLREVVFLPSMYTGTSSLRFTGYTLACRSLVLFMSEQGKNV